MQGTTLGSDNRRMDKTDMGACCYGVHILLDADSLHKIKYTEQKVISAAEKNKVGNEGVDSWSRAGRRDMVARGWEVEGGHSCSFRYGGQ